MCVLVLVLVLVVLVGRGKTTRWTDRRQLLVDQLVLLVQVEAEAAQLETFLNIGRLNHSFKFYAIIVLPLLLLLLLAVVICRRHGRWRGRENRVARRREEDEGNLLQPAARRHLSAVRVHRLGVPMEAMADEHWPVGGKGAHAAEDPGQSGTTWRGNRVTGPSP